MEDKKNGAEVGTNDLAPSDIINQQHTADLAQITPDASKNYSYRELLSMQAEILLQIEEAGGEISEETDLALSLVDIRSTNKVDACVHMMDLFESRAEFFKKKENEFKAGRQTCENLVLRMKNRIKADMQSFGLETAMGNEYRFTINTRTNPNPTVNEEILPVEYCKVIQKYVPDRERISADLELGLEIPGAKFDQIVTLRHPVNTPEKQSKKKALK